MPSISASLRGALVGCCGAVVFHFAGATGLQPASTIVQLSASDGQAQMSVGNTETVPLMMNVTVLDLPGSESLTVMPLPQVTRVEPESSQLVRFVLTESATPITRQYLKRVSFEGIPPMSTRPGEKLVAVNVRQILPMVISPAGLVQDGEPWKKLQIRRTGTDAMELRNDSPFVVRLRMDAELLPMKSPVRMLGNNYVLPGEHIAFDLPKGVEANAVQAVRISPASPWGFKVDTYEIDVSDAGAP